MASLLLTQAAVAAKVVVFGLDPRNVSAEATKQGTQTLLTTLGKLPGVEVIDPQTAKARLGVDLVQQAKACQYDVFCLVELGELLDADQLLVGHVSQPAPTDSDADLGLELKLMVLEVVSASTVDVLLWRVQDLDSTALAQACDAGARRLFSTPDVEVQFALTPPGAEVRLYGEPVDLKPEGASMPYWSGTYDALVRAEGYEPKRFRIRLDKGQASLTVPLALEQDPLWVQTKSAEVRPFDRPSRRRAGPLNLVAPPEAEASSSLLPWALGGGGVAVVVLGGFVMQRAQADYNNRSAEARYVGGVTRSAAVAINKRSAARLEHRIGSGALIGGLVALLGAGVWMLLDTPKSLPSRTPMAGQGAPAPAVRLAASRLAQELTW